MRIWIPDNAVVPYEKHGSFLAVWVRTYGRDHWFRVAFFRSFFLNMYGSTKNKVRERDGESTYICPISISFQVWLLKKFKNQCSKLPPVGMGGGWSLNSIRDTPSFNSRNRKTISNHEYENRTLPPQNWNPPSSTSAAPSLSFNLKTPTIWNCLIKPENNNVCDVKLS